jgi:hypothetical protein
MDELLVDAESHLVALPLLQEQDSLVTYPLHAELDSLVTYPLQQAASQPSLTQSLYETSFNESTKTLVRCKTFSY